MTRADLLALTDADLEIMSNRGTVKRARREVDNDETPYSLALDEAGTVTVIWADEQITTKLLSDKALKDCKCSCPVVGICRHIIKGVIAYQHTTALARGAKQTTKVETVAPAATTAPAATEPSVTASAAGTPNATPLEETPLEEVPPDETPLDETPLAANPLPEESWETVGSWDPGEFADDAVKQFVGAQKWSRAEGLLADGQIVELARGPKPFAKFHTLAHSIRFLVPHNLLYTRCDCAEIQPCIHIPLSVLAFRLLDSQREAGIVNTTSPAPFQDDDLVAEVEDAFQSLYINGIAGAQQVAVGKLKRCVERCHARMFFWPAEILNEILTEITRYHERDSRFSAAAVAMLIAECLSRFDAIKSNTGVAPVEFIRGFASDKATAVTSSRLVGLGCGASITRRGTTLTAYIQDVYSGNLLTVKKDFSYKADDENMPRLAGLADRSAFKALGLAQLSRGQLLIKGGNLSASRQYEPGRAKFSFNHQNFQWENLRPPLCVDSFAELASILSSQLPSYLTSRYSGRNFFVCTVTGATGAHWNEAEQAVEATLLDASGNCAQLTFPFLTVCSEGADALLHPLQKAGEAVRFVAGHVHMGRHGLNIVPVSVVFDDGEKRTMVQPWVDRRPGDVQPTHEGVKADAGSRRRRDPMLTHFADVFEEMGSTLTAGLQSIDAHTVAGWNRLARESESLGFSRLPDLIQSFSQQLAQKQNRMSWQPGAAVQAAINVTILALIAREEALRNAD